jgi:hypothetical protein
MISGNRWGKGKRWAVLALVCACLLGMALEGMEEESTPAESDMVKYRVFDLGVVEVVETYQDQKNKTVDRVYDEEMRDLGKNFLADALNILPGVTVTQLGARNEMMEIF